MCLIWVQDGFEKDSRTGSVPNNVESEVEKEPGVGELGGGGPERSVWRGGQRAEESLGGRGRQRIGCIASFFVIWGEITTKRM